MDAVSVTNMQQSVDN